MSLEQGLLFYCSLIKLMRIKGLPRFMRKFCLDMVTKTIQYREINNIVRKDLMQYLIQLRNNSATDIDEWKIKTSGKFRIFNLKFLVLTKFSD